MAQGGEPLVLLRHGTTRQRAEAILRAGPDPRFREPGGPDTAEGFSTARSGGANPLGIPEVIAAGKASQFPEEGGPAILEIKVPESIVRKADLKTEVRFEPGFGLEELLDAWASLPKRVFVP